MAEWFSDGQGDFFDDINHSSPKIRKRIGAPIKEERILPAIPPKNEQGLLFPKEYMVFSVLMIIILMLGSFFVGIERGKYIVQQEYSYREQKKDITQNIMLARANEQKKLNIPTSGFQNPGDRTMQIVAKKPVIRNTLVNQIIADSPRMSPIKKNAVSQGDASYAIQLATYIKADCAEREIANLKQKGFATFKQKSGKYYVLCAGPFMDKDKATSVRVQLARFYKDCFLKKMK